MMRKFFIIFAVSVLLPLNAYAKSDPPDISGVMVMNDPDAIVVEGVNFAADTPLLVTLGAPDSPGDITDDCTLEDDTLITCDFSEGLGLPLAGDYRLVVRTGSGKDKQSNGYDLTIGAIGPTGADGADGGTGPAGADGDDGATGADGATGSAGSDGADGADGATGPAGATGADGANCSITACIEPGEATLTCGTTSVTSACICYVIGDTGPAGGIVFYMTEECTHGLEAALEDQALADWGCQGELISGADGLIIGTGAQNTADIIAGCPTAGIAARIADSFSLGGFNDWFLPSLDELNELFLQQAVVGGFISLRYWSSSEQDSSFAWTQRFTDGSQAGIFKNATGNLGARAVRAF
jgi:hypothetical protein